MSTSYERGIETEAKYEPLMTEWYKLTYDNSKITKHRNIQKGLGTDRLASLSGVQLKCEDKYINNKDNYYRVFIELYQNTTIVPFSKGWITESKADVLHYCWCTPEKIEVLVFDFRRLKEWFKENRLDYEMFTVETEDTKPRGILVPVLDFPGNVLLERSYIYAEQL